MGDFKENSMSAPFKCPLTACNQILSSSMLLTHFIQTHQRDENNVDIKEIEQEEKTSLIVAGDFLKVDKNVCLGIMTYSIEEKKHSNVLLMRDFKHLENQLPILIMACRGNFVKMMDSESEFIDPEADFVIIWLLSPETTIKHNLHATVTVHDEEFKKSLSSFVQVRSPNHSQNVRDFLDTATNFVTIHSGFLKQISTDESFMVEISIFEI